MKMSFRYGIYISLMKKIIFLTACFALSRKNCSPHEISFSSSVFETICGECGMGNTISHCFIQFCSSLFYKIEKYI